MTDTNKFEIMTWHEKQECAERAYEELNQMAAELDLLAISTYVLDSPRFKKWSGTSRKGRHHYGDFGLIIHVWEVTIVCFRMADFYGEFYSDIDRKELFLACLYHDYAKTQDYIRDGEGGENYHPGPHQWRIHHIPGSVIYWQRSLDKYQKRYPEGPRSLEEYREPVSHAILSHHGRRELASPVEPATRVAVLLHAADTVSARIYDCDMWE